MMRGALLILAAFVLAACAGSGADGPPPGTAAEKARLEAAILQLGPGVDPEEARRAAALAFDETHRLALAYEITDPPLIHNTKVNLGQRPRGLCWHWAHDLEARLAREGFTSLQLHRAIANADTILIDHSTVIVSRRGETMFDGIVLDPWRNGGVLFWSPTRKDKRYKWVPRQEVFDKRRRAAG